MNGYAGGDIRFPAPIVLADVGGTNCRIACISEAGGATGPMHRLPTAGYHSFADALATAVRDGLVPMPRSVLVAGAGAITGGFDGPEIHLTNPAGDHGRFVIAAAEIARAFRLEQGVLLNDFEALAIALPHLCPTDQRTIGPARPTPQGPKLVVGAGTGLGVAALLPVAGAWLPVASEGGHVEVGPLSAEDATVWPHLPRFDGRIAAEHLLSGAGLVRLHEARALAGGRPPPRLDATAITMAARGGDAAALATFDHFSALLGRVVGDHALTFLATGGVWIGGGIVPRLADRFAAGPFRAAFERKAPHGPLMESFATQLVTAPDAALKGLRALVDAPASVLLDWNTRLWRPLPTPTATPV